MASPISDPDESCPKLSVSDSFRRAARALSESPAPGVLVYDNDALIGFVSSRALLGELCRDEDPVTGLPRAGALRDWLGEKLMEGFEAAVVFLDMDRFGEINANKGHTEGDAALRRIAESIYAVCSPETDFCARYGGDEFAIGTLLPRTDADRLAHEASCALVAIGMPATFGVSGGRRSVARAAANVGSMVEELLRLASLACMSKKQRRD